MSDQVNEQSTAYLAVTFKNKAGAAEAPASASYRIDDLATGEPVRAETSLPATGTVEIKLTPADNTILNPLNRYEHRQVTVIGLYGEDDAVRAEFLYRVINLSKVQ